MQSAPAPRRDDESLEAPAYLGRPFPGTNRYPARIGSPALAGLGLVLGLSLLGIVMNTNAGNVPAIVGFAALGIAALLGGFFVVRAQVRQAMRTEGRTMPRL